MLIAHFHTLARYNSIANQRLYEACAQLDDAEYRRERRGSFRSIHWTLNHILLGDRLWMDRFSSPAELATPPLATVLYDDFARLREARRVEDARIEAFMRALEAGFLARPVTYVNSEGRQCSDPAPLLLAHMFNHQTHHRGQVHVMLSQTAVKPPALDMHRAIRPAS